MKQVSSALKAMPFADVFVDPILGVMWLASLLQISFGYHFNQSIAEFAWPASLQLLTFDWEFNQPIVGVGWSASLQWGQLQSVHRGSCVAGLLAAANVRLGI